MIGKAEYDYLKKAITDIQDKIKDIYHDWPEFKGLIISHDKELEYLKERMSNVELTLYKRGRVNHPYRDSNPPSASEFAKQEGIAVTDTGTFKLDENIMNRLARRAHDSEIKAQAISEYVDTWRKRVLFILAIAGPVGTGIGWALSHFLHW